MTETAAEFRRRLIASACSAPRGADREMTDAFDTHFQAEHAAGDDGLSGALVRLANDPLMARTLLWTDDEQGPVSGSSLGAGPSWWSG